MQRRIGVDEIHTRLVLHVPGLAAADKKRKAELIRKHFNASWTEIEEVMPLFDLRAGYDSLHRELEGVQSRYGAVAAPVQDDGIPDFLDRRKPNGATEASFVELEGVPSRYAAVPTAEASRRDGIPDFLDRRKPNGATEASFVDLVGGDRG